jgi:hypothetical protein
MGMRFLVGACFAFHPEARIKKLAKACKFGYCIVDGLRSIVGATETLGDLEN